MNLIKQNRVAVVTGASAGIGAATVIRLLNDGWIVVGVDQNLLGFERIAAAYPGRAQGVNGDVRERTTHDRARQLAEQFGQLLSWVNNAGIERPTRAHDLDDQVFEQILRINLYGYAYGCSVACDAFVQTRLPGAIVNVSSVRALAAFPSGFAYDTSKGAIDSMTRQVAIEYGHFGIRCNGVRPGCIMTPGVQAELDVADNPEKKLREWGDFHPLERRMGQPQEVAAVIAFLLSADASFVSGALLNVDGAMTARCYPYAPDPTISAR
jgi:glucose 1-dehydrogenase